MAWTFGSSAATSDVLTCTLNSVVAGELVVLWHKYEDSTGTPAVSDGTQSMTVRGVNQHGTAALFGFFAYYIAASSGNKTFTVTGSSSFFQRTVAMRFSNSGTIAFDTDRSDGDSNSTAINSGSITTTGSDELVVASYGEFSGNTFSSPLINGAAPDATINAVEGRVWYETNAGAFTGAASATLSPAAEWICSVIAFKATAAGGTGLDVPRNLRTLIAVNRAAHF